MKVIASKKPLSQISDRTPPFTLMSKNQLKGIELEIGEEEPAEWTEHDVEIHTYARDQAPIPAGSKRYAVFFGVADYQFNQRRIRACLGGQGKAQSRGLPS